MRDGKHHYIAVSSLIIILIVAGIILNLSKPADLEARVNQEVETQEEIVAESPVPFETVGDNVYEANVEVEPEPVVVEEKSCDKISFDVTCDTEHSLYPCENINDNNKSTEWFAGYSCPDDRVPCVVSNNVELSADQSFKYIKLLNRVSPDFYINRVLISYNDFSKVTFKGGQQYSQTPWLIELEETTQEAKINIVEIMGVGYRYQAGLSEIELYECLK